MSISSSSLLLDIFLSAPFLSGNLFFKERPEKAAIFPGMSKQIRHLEEMGRDIRQRNLILRLGIAQKVLHYLIQHSEKQYSSAMMASVKRQEISLPIPLSFLSFAIATRASRCLTPRSHVVKIRSSLYLPQEA